MDMWVELVMAVVDSEGDIPTLGAWAVLAGKSVGSLRLHCYAIHQAPRRALLFARLLRAVVSARGRPWDIGEWLHAADPRTLTKAAQLGGIPGTAVSAPTVTAFLAGQRLLAAECRALDAVRVAIGSRAIGSVSSTPASD
jgi:hypothetical protein